VKKSHNQDLRVDPAWNINSGKIDSNPVDFPDPRWLKAEESSPLNEGTRDCLFQVLGLPNL